MLHSYSVEGNEIDESLISGFLSALESFVANLTTGSGLNEIDYKSLKVIGSASEKLRVVAMVNESPGKGFHERLDFFTEILATDYADEIESFEKDGNQTVIKELNLDELAQEILAI